MVFVARMLEQCIAKQGLGVRNLGGEARQRGKAKGRAGHHILAV